MLRPVGPGLRAEGRAGTERERESVQTLSVVYIRVLAIGLFGLPDWA